VLRARNGAPSQALRRYPRTTRRIQVAGNPLSTKDELLRDVWPGAQLSRSTRTLDSHACRLRHKLRAQGDRYLETLWGVGYRLTSPDPARTRP
jgi:DNA-binding winged helix-turn-helix (wHTH) protein